MEPGTDPVLTREQILERFRKLFGRDPNPEERRSLSLSDLPDEPEEPARGNVNSIV
jgi:hypothetical protein